MNEDLYQHLYVDNSAASLFSVSSILYILTKNAQPLLLIQNKIRGKLKENLGVFVQTA